MIFADPRAIVDRRPSPTARHLGRCPADLGHFVSLSIFQTRLGEDFEIPAETLATLVTLASIQLAPKGLAGRRS
jgi:hypothetical protein